MGLKVIGAGQPRTGTHSLKLALEMLKLGPCYHMLRLLEEHPEEVVHFINARDGKSVDWDALVGEHQSAVDFPMSLYYQDLMKKYPDAKVILSLRDTEKWYQSISATVFKASQPTPMRMLTTLIQLPFVSSIRKRLPVLKYAGRMIRDFYGSDLHNKEAVTKKYEDWNKEVIATVSASNLLVFDVKEGWGPLCAFLGVPVPKEPFPNTNNTKEFQERAKILT